MKTEIAKILAKAELSSIYCASDQLFADLAPVEDHLSVQQLLRLYEIRSSWSKGLQLARVEHSPRPSQTQEEQEAKQGAFLRYCYLENEFLLHLFEIIRKHQNEFLRYLEVWRQSPENSAHKLMLVYEMTFDLKRVVPWQEETSDFMLKMQETAWDALQFLKKKLGL